MYQTLQESDEVEVSAASGEGFVTLHSVAVSRTPRTPGRLFRFGGYTRDRQLALPAVSPLGFDFWSRWRESNPLSQLTKLVDCRYPTLA